MKPAIISILAVFLAGCLAAPEPELPRLADVDLAEDAPQGPSLVAPEQDQKGLFAGLFGRKPEAPASQLPAEDAGADEAAEPTPRRFALFGPRTPAPESAAVTPDTVLPFGELAVACGISGKALGKEVDRFPERGKGYRLYDTNPKTTGPRTHYLTGFRDGCPRQFTAALAMLGSPVLHESVRYDGANSDLGYTATDKAYERIKARICHTGRGKPCPEGRIKALEKSMGFLTLYEHFGSNARWGEVLLHEGRLEATAIRSR